MPRYFKLVCISDEENFVLSEFFEGRARFGWSPPGSDLRDIQKTDSSERSDEQNWTWRYTKFLITRVSPGDRVVIQMERPLRSFVIAEVMEPGYESIPGDLKDFNHVLHVRSLTDSPIPANSNEVSDALKHDLSKRGHYYEIYPESSIEELDRIVTKASSKTLNLGSVRTDSDTHDRTFQIAKKRLSTVISEHWRAQSFEKFCEMLCESVDYIEVKERKDRHKGWDLMVRLLNPLSGEIAIDDIPVQCKNFSGHVSSFGPIDDLERSIQNTNGALAFLFIMGDIGEEFRTELAKRQEALSRELKRNVTFELIDQDRIAELYFRHAAKLI